VNPLKPEAYLDSIKNSATNTSRPLDHAVNAVREVIADHAERIIQNP
jgi:hypothetical protein